MQNQWLLNSLIFYNTKIYFIACLVCSESMKNKSIRYTSVQTVQPLNSDSAKRVEKTNQIHPTNCPVDIASSQLTEEKLLEHDNVSTVLMP